jgi:RloB-like protein
MARSRSSARSTSRRSRKNPQKRPHELDRGLLESLRRPEPSREPRKAILIALEDRQSARLYFDGFRNELRGYWIVILAPWKGSDPKSVVEAAKEARDARRAQAARDEADPFDEVWVVFDTEGPQDDHRQRAARGAIDQARSLKFLTAVSNPSFEYWLLLHFEWCVRTLADGAAVCHLLERHIPGYDKGMDCYAITRSHVPTAIKHAKRVFAERHQGSSHHPCDCHACTEVHRLIESLLAEA